MLHDDGGGGADTKTQQMLSRIAYALVALGALLRACCRVSWWQRRWRRGMRWRDALDVLSPRINVNAAGTLKLGAVNFLESFRQGPETHSEWNLLLWRVSFPMLTLVAFTALAVLGKCGHLIYSFVVCPLWYFSQLMLVTQPFLLVFRFRGERVDAKIRFRVWRVLAMASMGISAMEWYQASPPSDDGAMARPTMAAAVLKARSQQRSWIVANTLFGVIALIAIPWFFYMQHRVPARDSYDTLAATNESATGAAFSTAPTSSAVTATSTSATSSLHAVLPVSPRSASPRRIRSRSRGFSFHEESTTATAPLSSSTTSMPSSPSAKERQRSQLMLLCVACVGVVWAAMYASYRPSGRRTATHTGYWLTTYLLAPMICVLLLFALRRDTGTRFTSLQPSSFEHVVVYSVVIVHLPVFLGHLCFRLFTLVELADPAHPAHGDSGHSLTLPTGTGGTGAGAGDGDGDGLSASTSWMKLGISVVFLLVMQTYFYVMTQVVNAMSEPFAHPSLLYLGQLYYYVFWYVLVGSDTPIDALYWGMLLLNNVHIAFLNTGFYADVKQSSMGCCSLPILSTAVLGGQKSVALCFRATTMTMINATARQESKAKSSVDLDSTPDHFLRDDQGLWMAAVNMESPATGSRGHQDQSSERVGSSGVLMEIGATAVQRASRRFGAPTSTSTANGSHTVVLDGIATDEEEEKHFQTTRKQRHLLAAFTASAKSLLPFTTTAPVPASSSMPSRNNPSYQEPCSRRLTKGVSRAVECGNDTCGPRSRSSHASTRASNAASMPPGSTAPSRAAAEHLRPLYFLMKLAEQDNMADTTALILVPSLLTLLAVLDNPSHGFSIVVDQVNLWLRCICMFVGRLGGSYLAREIFAYKLRARLRLHQQRKGDSGDSEGWRARSSSEELLNTIDGVSTRLWIQKLMLQDFHRQFWYLTVVTIVVVFACFERIELPTRFALLA